MNDNYCIIMAGGIGSRFWPVSRTDHPKQFIDILGTGESLIQQTFNRFKKICNPENIFIVTNQEYKELTLEQLPDINESQVICEPSRRNTAPCIAYANFKIAGLNPNANIIVTPADHLILKQDVFSKVITDALKFTKNQPYLLTIGIKPSRPDTGYGYIKYNNESDTGICDVVKFTEKPDLEKATNFLKSGDYSWNSGMFIWSLKEIQNSMEQLLPEVYTIFNEGKEFFNTSKEDEFIEKAYANCPEISIDYGVMEKANNVKVINADFGWSDLGTWGSLYEHIDRDENKNALISGNVNTYDSKNNIVSFPKGKKAVIQGLDNYIVVDTDKAFLICRKDDEQQIKKFVELMKKNGELEFL